MATGASRMCEALVAAASAFALPWRPGSRLVWSMLDVDFKSTWCGCWAPSEAWFPLLVCDLGKCCSGELAVSLSFASDAVVSVTSAIEGPSSVVHGSHNGSASFSPRGTLLVAVDGYRTSEKPTRELSALPCFVPSPPLSQGRNIAEVESGRCTHSKSVNRPLLPLPAEAAALALLEKIFKRDRFLFFFSDLVNPRTKIPSRLTCQTHAASEEQDPIWNVDSPVSERDGNKHSASSSSTPW
mmetsp:Transcript_28834/g.62112  ORF Transcript_28834/g.62112 Transcript_28834/m.62112 type:complete len:241 (-) Transcript_28834:398-1120(-)